MGIAKNDWIMCDERGYGHCENYVCRDCIGNKSLQEYIKNNGHMGICYYCHKRRKVITIEELLKPIMSGIRFEYDEAVNCLGYQDGEYVGKTYDTHDLIHDEIIDELMIDNESILSDLVNTIDDIIWCKTNPYSEKEYETEFYSWQSFCKLVKNHKRYMFYKSNNIINPYDLSNPVNILDIIGEHIQGINLIKRIPINERIYRGRMHRNNECLNSFQDFAPPPNNKAKANRMSAEGIPLFYAAFDNETVLAEIGGNLDRVTIANFTPQRNLTVINLSKLKTLKLPSIFDESNRHKRSAITFLKLFEEEISRKIDDSPAIEYVPTQIVTEYFRYVFESKKYGQIDGIIYNSSQIEDKKCIVLFMNNTDYFDDKKCLVNKLSMRLSIYKKEYSWTL